MTTAENLPDPSGAQGAAPGAELTIPKHRFDEINERLRKAEEREAIKDQLMLRQIQTQQAATRPQARPTRTAEELGIDPQLMKAVEILTEDRLAGEREQIGQYIGNIKNEAEIAVLLATHGADKAKHLEEIKRLRTRQWNETGTFLSAEMALKMVLADETSSRERTKDARIAALEAQLAGKQADPTASNPGTSLPLVPPPHAGVPNAAATRQVPTGGAPAGSIPASAKSFAELTVEEMEARLEQQFGAGARL